MAEIRIEYPRGVSDLVFSCTEIENKEAPPGVFVKWLGVKNEEISGKLIVEVGRDLKNIKTLLSTLEDLLLHVLIVETIWRDLLGEERNGRLES